MILAVALNTGPLGLITHPKAHDEAVAALAWVRALVTAGAEVHVPSVCEYELRRKLLHIGSTRALRSLDQTMATLRRIPISDDVLRQAATLWAQARQQGRLTSDEKELDVDVILAAQANSIARPERRVVVATTNVKHLSWFADARPWREISV